MAVECQIDCHTWHTEVYLSPETTAAHDAMATGAHDSLDQVDLELLHLLAVDARLSQRALAREVGMSPPAVAERLARLERTGVIRGYRIEIDFGSIDRSFVAWMGLTTVQGARQRDLVAKLRHLPEIEEVDLVTGPMDLMVRVRVRDHAHMRDLLFDHILPLEGVNRTETFISLESMEPKNFVAELLSSLRGGSQGSLNRPTETSLSVEP
jgi:Lrp/AsnC family leucine-responsive transcriptional regulator